MPPEVMDAPLVAFWMVTLVPLLVKPWKLVVVVAQSVGMLAELDAPKPAKSCVYEPMLVIEIAAFAALAAIIAQVPAARRVMVFMFFMLSVLSIV